MPSYHGIDTAQQHSQRSDRGDARNNRPWLRGVSKGLDEPVASSVNASGLVYEVGRRLHIPAGDSMPIGDIKRVVRLESYVFEAEAT